MIVSYSPFFLFFNFFLVFIRLVAEKAKGKGNKTESENLLFLFCLGR